MTVIDADAHVVECEHTWDFLEPHEQALRPTLVNVPGQTGRNALWWYIDGRLANTGPVAFNETVKAIRELEDVPGRLRHMDELGTDVQVLFPTLFLRPLTTRPEVERALYRSYNRWLAERCAGQPRLRWAVALPFMTPEAALEELRFGAEHGACAVFMRGVEGDRSPSHPSYFPVYAEAERLGLPMCIHAANGSFAAHDLFADDPGFWRFKFPGINAFHTLLTKGIPEQFPRLRFGFVELSAQWVPYAVHDLRRRSERTGRALPDHLLAANRIFVACQTDDDLPYVLRYAGDDNLVMGTDYGHADTSSEIEALRNLQADERVAPVVAGKILGANAAALYGL